MKPFLFLLLITVLFSCQKIGFQEKEAKELILKDTVVYLSGSNCMASIKLSLIPNKTFNFNMEIYPYMMQDSIVESDFITSTGTWKGTEERLLLTFAKREKDTLHLDRLFDSKANKGFFFNLFGNKPDDTDIYTVEIDYTSEYLNIWGSPCSKTEIKHP